jgi:hypothetical protein
MRMWQRLIQTVGAASIFLSLWGAYLLVNSFRLELAHPFLNSKAPFFREVFLGMNAIDAAFLIVMIVTAIGLLMLRPNAARFYTWLYVVLVVYAFAPGVLWGISGPVGMSIAAASGVGDEGLAPLLFYPLPFVYPIASVLLVNIATRRLSKPINALESASGATASSW